MKAYPYHNKILDKATTQAAGVTGPTFRYDPSQSGGRVPPHEIEIQTYIGADLVSQNGAAGDWGVRFRLDTSLDGEVWLPVQIIANLTEEGTHQEIVMNDNELLPLLRVVVVPYSSNANLPTWTGTVHLISDGPLKLARVAAS